MESSTAPGASFIEPALHGAALSRRDKVLALAGTLAALLMAGLDQTIVATAGPEIQRDLQIPAALYAWLTTSYLVASTVMLPIYGKLSDLFGRKPILLVGVGFFLLGSLLCGFSTRTGLLIAARAVQGIGAASLFTTTLAVIADLFPPRERGKYMGLIAAVMGISSVVGPIAGGVITDLLGWHWVFFINLPVGAVALWLIVRHMPSFGGRRGERVRIDFPGALWLIVGVVPLLLALSLGRVDPAPGDGYAWGSPPILALFLVSALGILTFLRTERRAPDPIIDLGLFSRNRTIGMATLTMFVLGATFLFTVIFLPLYLVNVVGISATRAGLSLTPLTLAMVATSVISGQLASRLGSVRALLTVALSVLLIAFLIMGFTLSPDSTQTEVTLKMILIGLGMGPTLPLYTLIVQNAAKSNEIGVVTSGSIFARSLGQVIGIALFGTLFATTLTTSVSRMTETVLQPLGDEERALVVGAMPAVAGAGEGTAVGFDAAAVRARIEAAAREGVDVEAPDAGPRVRGDAAFAPAGETTAAALRAVEGVENAFNVSLTRAVTTLYRIGALLVVLGLGLTLLIPVEGSGRLSRRS